MMHQDGNIPISVAALHANHLLKKYFWENKTAVHVELKWDKTLLLIGSLHDESKYMLHVLLCCCFSFQVLVATSIIKLFMVI